MSHPIYGFGVASNTGSSITSPVKILNDAMITSRLALVNYKNNVTAENIGTQKQILLNVLQTQAALTYYVAQDL
jgi:hypothetical protein